ncbi:MAG: carbamoyltransferase HypF [Gallionellaceae bacterium]|nr:carbamoyltransferase HypF [Gallionellaceae bacterium]
MTAPQPLSEYVDCTIQLPHAVKPVLAMGAWFKNTLCVTSGSQAFVSKTVGDLDMPDACRAHEQTARMLLARLGEKPVAIAHDLHPDFHSTRFAGQLAAELDVPLIAAQHHHAHIAALAAEHGIEEPVLGLALDGIGLGADGNAWGGELLRVAGAEFQRLGHLRPLPLPGGDRAAREPWRMAAAVLHGLGRNSEIARRFADQPAAATVATMLQRGLNCPLTSSTGRVFDAAAGLLDLCHKMEFEAQAAIALERAATRYVSTHGMPQALTNGWQIDKNGQLGLLPLFAHLADTADAERGAAVFHATLIAALTDWVVQAVQQTGIKMLACGGGCFFNKLLSAGLRERLEGAGLKTLTAKLIQPGDTAIALGQAWVAAQFFKTLAD